MSASKEIRRAVPPDLYGKHEHDRLLRLTDRIVSALVWSLPWTSAPLLEPAVNGHTRKVRVAQRTEVAKDGSVVAFSLEPLDGEPLPTWQPGCHIDVTLPSGRYRQYSLCGLPADRFRYRIAVRRIEEGRGGSREAHDAVAEGSVLSIGSPRNAFPFAVGGEGLSPRHIRFIAGGIGLTPLLPMAQAAQRLGLDWSMVYTGRDIRSMAFLDELGGFGDKVTLRPDADLGPADPAELLGDLPPGSSAYCCGPPPMIEAVRAKAALLPGVVFFSERFSPPEIIDGHPFELLLERSGRTVCVPEDRSALDVLLDDMPDLPHSCRQGFCGSCRVLTTAGHSFLPCVERVESGQLSLDL